MTNEIETFWRCQRCQTFIISAEGVLVHKRKCTSEEEEDGQDGLLIRGNLEKCRADKTSARLEEMKIIKFIQPNLILERVDFSGSLNPHTFKDSTLAEEVTDKVIPIRYASATPRTSSLRALKKIQEACKGKTESGSDDESEFEIAQEEQNYDEEVGRRQRINRRKGGKHKRSETTSCTEKKPDNSLHCKRADDRFNKNTCTICCTKFKSDARLKFHLKSVHENESNQEVFTCPLCGRMLIKRLVFQNHLKRHENAEANEMAFDLWNKFPERTNNKNLPVFPCKFCLLPHTKHYSFIKHMQAVHPDKERYHKFSCPYSCTLKFDSMKLFLIHMKDNHTEEYYGKTVKWSLSYEPKKEGKPKGVCDICGKHFNVWYLQTHKDAVHSKRKPKNQYTCPIVDCGTHCVNAEGLKTHFILHLENNPFMCMKASCNVKCTSQDQLEHHMKLHSGESAIRLMKTTVDEMQNVDLDEMLIKSEDGSEVIKNEELSPPGSPQCFISEEHTTDANCDPTSESDVDFEPSAKKVRNSKRNVNDIDKLIRSDPVFRRICKENPRFEKIMFCKRKKYPLKSKDCPECDKKLSCRASMLRHMFIVHGIKQKPVVKSVVVPKKWKKKKTKNASKGKTSNVASKSQQKRKKKISEKNESLVSSSKDFVINIKTEPEFIIDGDNFIEPKVELCETGLGFVE